jgi:hypothetical protein
MLDVQAASGSQPGNADMLDAAIQAALARITTTAPADQIATVSDPRPIGVSEFDVPQAALAEAGPLIGLPAFHSDSRFAGIDGSGYSIVVLDSGADLDHPFFGPDADGDGVADRIVYHADFVGDSPGGADLFGHGTHVTSIVASQDSTYPGVAPGVNIIELRVLNASGSGSAASIEAALQWAATHVTQYNIVGVNISLSFGDNSGSPTTRPELGIYDELAALAAQDVIISSASGNSFFTYNGIPGVSYPSSDPSSLSVGAVWDADAGGPFEWGSGARDVTTGADRITSFSQRHPTMTTVMAPGAAITAAAIGGGTTVMSGTSMAAPIITGVAALMQQLSVQTTGHRLSLSQFADWVSDTGISIFDGDDEDDNVPNTQQTYHRVDVMALADAVLSSGLSNLTVPKGLAVTSPEAPAGGTARVSFTIANQGGADAGSFSSGLYLSTDSTIDGSDMLLTEVSDQLAAGQTVERKGLMVSLPAGLAPGQYYLGLLVDNQNSVAEGNETNNSVAVPFAIIADGAMAFLVDAATEAQLISGTALNFGQIIQGPSDITRSLRLYNDGNVDLDAGSLDLPAGFSAIGLPQIIAPGTWADFSISLIGSSTPGDYSGIASFSVNDTSFNTFTLQVSGSVLEPDDHGNDASSATSVLVESITNGRILRTGDVDWFRFDAVKGVHYQFATVLETLSDSVLRVIDRNGTTQLALDGGPGGGASSIDWTAPADGSYYLEVRGVLNQEGFYQLSVQADDDFGNSAVTATFTTDPSANPGIIESVGDQDWFAFNATAGVGYHFGTALSSLAGSALRIIDQDGTTELLASGVGNAGQAAALDWTPSESGRYYVVVQGAVVGPTGAYSLSIRGIDDYGDNAANARSLAVPAAVTGAIEDAEDVDWFSFAAVTGAHYQFSLLSVSAGAHLKLIGADGSTIFNESSAAAGLAATFQWMTPASGTYYLEASSDDGLGSYSLDVSVLDDHGDDAATATPVNTPSVNPGVIESGGDRDWVSFEAVAGTAYHFQVNLESLPSVVMQLVDIDGLTVINSTSGSGGAVVLDWTAPISGRYFVDVGAAAPAGTGNYQLVMLDDDDFGDDPQNAAALTIPEPINGTVEHLGDVDWFSLKALAGVEYRVDVTLGTLPGAQVKLMAPDGVTEINTAIAGAGAPAAVHWTATTAGTYFVVISEVQFSDSSSSTNEAAGFAESLPIGGSRGTYQVVPSVVSQIPGDFDGNQNIDGNDFLKWQRTLGATGPAGTAPLDANGFEFYNQSHLDGQFGWQQLGPSAGAAVVQSSVVFAGNKAVRVNRAANIDNWWGAPLGVTAPTGQFVFVGWEMRVSATGATNGGLGPFMGVQAYDDAGGFGLLGSLGVDATTLDVMYQREGDGVIVETGRKASPDNWYSYGMLFDFSAGKYTVYFEEQPLVTNDLVDLHVPGASLDRLTDADIAALAAQADHESQKLAGTAYFDDFRIIKALSSTIYPADANHDGVVDRLDLEAWQNQFGVAYGAHASASGGFRPSMTAELLAEASAPADGTQSVDGEIKASVAADEQSLTSQPTFSTAFLPLQQQIGRSQRETDRRLWATESMHALRTLAVRDAALVRIDFGGRPDASDTSMLVGHSHADARELLGPDGGAGTLDAALDELFSS